MPAASIFLVEDEALIRMMLAEMVEELGHRVVAEAGNIVAGQALAETAIFDLAILDINIGLTNLSQKFSEPYRPARHHVHYRCSHYPPLPTPELALSSQLRVASSVQPGTAKRVGAVTLWLGRTMKCRGLE